MIVAIRHGSGPFATAPPPDTVLAVGDVLIGAGSADEIRRLEREIMMVCVRQAGMPRRDFITTFPKNETNTRWIDKHIRAKRKHSAPLGRLKEEVLKRQQALKGLERSELFRVQGAQFLQHALGACVLEQPQLRRGRFPGRMHGQA